MKFVQEPLQCGKSLKNETMAKLSDSIVLDWFISMLTNKL